MTTSTDRWSVFALLRRSSILRSRHFWLILIVFLLCSVHHYSQQIGLTGPDEAGLFGTTRHAIDRILFLFPIIYSGYIFGARAGLITTFAAFLVMLPRAFLISPVPLDASIEILGILAVGVFATLWIRTRTEERAKTQAEKAKTEAALEELRSMHTLLQHYVQGMRKNERRLTILNSISSILWGSLELEGLLRKATSLVSELMEVEVTLIFSLDEERKELVLVGHEGVSDEFARAVDRARVGEGLFGEVAKTGEPVIVEDLNLESDQTGPEFKKMQIRVQLIVPLVHRDRVTGVVCAAMRRPRQFTPEDVELLAAVGVQIAMAMDNARLYERERFAARRLAVSERNFRRLFENASDAIWTHDLAGNIIVANKAAEIMTGYSIEELTRMSVTSFLSPDSHQLANTMRRKLFLREPTEQPYEQHIIKRDGTEAILMLTSSLLTEDERPIGFQHMARDVTQEKWMQDSLRYYVQQIGHAQEEERKRIARDLHDDTAQELYALHRQVDNFLRSSADLPEHLAVFLKDSGQQIKKVLQGVRQFGQDLRPPMLEDLGLPATLRWLLAEVSKRSGIDTQLNIEGTERRLAPDTELAIFRIAQEAVRNAEKHSKASSLKVAVRFDDDRVAIKVNDDGVGFEPPERVDELSSDKKLGLVGMQERAKLLGGHLDLVSKPGKGTSVTLEVPGV